MLLLLSRSPLAHSTIYWVSATEGATTTSCPAASGNTPPSGFLRTITEGVACMTPGQGGHIVRVRNGTYSERIDWFGGGGVSGNPQIIEAENSRGVLWNTPSSSHLVINNVHYATIRGFIMDGSTGSWGSGGQGQYTALLVSGTERHLNFGCTDGGNPSTCSSNILIDNNEFRQTAYGFAQINHQSHHITFRSNWIHFQCKVRNCNVLYGGGPDTVFENNTVEDIAGAIALWVQGFHTAHRGIFRNNIFRRIEGYWSTQNGTVQCCVTGACPGGSEGLTCSQRMPKGHPTNTTGLFITSGDNTQVYNNIFEPGSLGLYLDSGVTACQVYNNTLYGAALGFGNVENGGFTGASGCAARNNIVYFPAGGEVPITNLGTGNSFGTNICSSGSAGGLGCTVTNPGITSGAGGNFQLLAGSPAINTGADLSASCPGCVTDQMGTPRPAGAWDIGALERATSPSPDPVNLLAWWKLDEGSGTTAADSSGNGHPGTLDSAAWGPGILLASAFKPTGSQEITVANTTGLNRTTSISVNMWVNIPFTAIPFCPLLANQETYSLYTDLDGTPAGYLWNGTSYEGVVGAMSLFGAPHMLTFTYDSGVASPTMRLYVDAVQVATQITASTMAYNQAGGAFRIGRDGLTFGHAQCPATYQDIRVYSGQLDQASITALFNDQVPAPGMSVTHSRYEDADVALGTFPVATDADHRQVLGLPFGIRWAVHKADTGSLTEYLRIFCRTFTSGAWNAWTEVTNTLDTLGVRFYVDSVVNVGDAVPLPALLPVDGFTAVPGVVIADTVDLTAPYDAAQRITLTQGQHAEQVARLVTGAPLVPGNLVQCKPFRENGVPLSGGYGPADSAVRTLTLQAVQPPSTVRLGVVTQGGTTR